MAISTRPMIGRVEEEGCGNHVIAVASPSCGAYAMTLVSSVQALKLVSR
jgi:hypothetical protein